MFEVCPSAYTVGSFLSSLLQDPDPAIICSVFQENSRKQQKGKIICNSTTLEQLSKVVK